MSATCPACKAPVQPQDTHCGACGINLRRAGTPISGGKAVGQAGNTTPIQLGTQQTPAAKPLQRGMLIAGRYRLEALVGRGAMGEVWRGKDENLGDRPRAIKRVLIGGATPQERAERQIWLKREADTLARLKHPTICDIHDVLQEDGDWYLILEWVEGQTLAEELASKGNPGLPEAEVLGWAAALCAAISYLHGQQPPVIFRDLKPSNIMLCQDRSVKLIDFGIARPVVTSGGTVIGTPGYAPPEQYQGVADVRSDEYALAATLYHLLTGRDPTAHQPFVFPPVQRLVPGLGPRLDAALQRALQMKPADRYPTVREFGAALAAIPRRAPRHVPPGYGRPIAIAAAGAGLVASALPWYGIGTFGIAMSFPGWAHCSYSCWQANVGDLHLYNWRSCLAIGMLLLGGACALRVRTKAPATGWPPLVLAASGVALFAMILYVFRSPTGLTSLPALTASSGSGLLLGFWLALICILLMGVGGLLMRREEQAQATRP